MERWLQEEYLRFGIQRHTSHALIKGVTGEKSVREIMDDLRAEDPEAEMLLGEYIVIEDED